MNVYLHQPSVHVVPLYDSNYIVYHSKAFIWYTVISAGSKSGYLSSERCSSSPTSWRLSITNTFQTTQHDTGYIFGLSLVSGFIYFFVGPQVYQYDSTQKHVVGVVKANSWIGCWNIVNPWGNVLIKLSNERGNKTLTSSVPVEWDNCGRL